MAEITKEQIIEALGKNPEIATAILPTFQETDAFKTLFDNKVDATYKEKIGEEVKKIHGLYDNQLEKAGFKAKVKEDGNKEKSYEMLDRYTGDYNRLKGMESSLNADERIKQIQADNEKLKAEGAGGHYKELYEQVKSEALTKEQELNSKIQEMSASTDSFKKGIEIKSAVAQLKFNPDVSESVRKMIVKNVEEQLISSSKLQDGKLVFIDGDGKQINNPSTYQPKTAIEMLQSMETIKDITLKEDASAGGGASRTIVGAVETVSVEGKDTKRLNLDSVSFKSQSEFIEIAEQKLSESGITVNDEAWSQLKDKAFGDYGIGKLPAN